MPVLEPGFRPTRKLLAATLSGVILYVISRFTDIDPAIEQAVNVAAMLVIAYFVPNDPTPGGVPDAQVVVVPPTEVPKG